VDTAKNSASTLKTLILDETDKKVLASDATCIILQGPVGVGKTTIFLIKLLQFAEVKMGAVNGIRRCHVLVFRRSEPEMQAFFQALYSVFPGAEIKGRLPWFVSIRRQNDDKTISNITMDIDICSDDKMSIDARAAGRAANVIFVNEIQLYSSPYIIQKFYERAGRAGSAADGNLGNKLVFADLNPPAESHWLYDWYLNPPGNEIIEGLKSDFRVEYITYPPALNLIENDQGDIVGFEKNEEAESMYAKRPDGYRYWLGIAQMNIKNRPFIYQNILGKFGYSVDGRPVYDGYWKPKAMVTSKPMIIDQDRLVYIGVDPSGFNPAALVGQRTNDGVLLIIHEFPVPAPNNTIFSEMFEAEILPWIKEYVSNPSKVLFLIDPSNAREQSAAKLTTTALILKAGFRAMPCRVGRLLVPRIEAVKWHMYNELLLVSKNCTQTINALTSDYYFKPGKKAPEQNHHQNSAPDLCASLEYLAAYMRLQSGFNYSRVKNVTTPPSIGSYNLQTLKRELNGQISASAMA
jgi:hypothetical protein